MSNVYAADPPTTAKVIIATENYGQLEIELFGNYAPNSVKAFLCLALSGYYKGTFIDRVEKDFVVGAGLPCPIIQQALLSYYESKSSFADQPAVDLPVFSFEPHSRLRFRARGYLAVSYSKADFQRARQQQTNPTDVKSREASLMEQRTFFFNLSKAPELDNQHTILGKLVGNSIYNLNHIAESDISLIPCEIQDVQIVINPFVDIVGIPLASFLPRKGEASSKKTDEIDSAASERLHRNRNILSFSVQDDEEEEDEDENDETNKKYEGEEENRVMGTREKAREKKALLSAFAEKHCADNDRKEQVPRATPFITVNDIEARPAASKQSAAEVAASIGMRTHDDQKIKEPSNSPSTVDEEHVQQPTLPRFKESADNSNILSAFPNKKAKLTKTNQDLEQRERKTVERLAKFSSKLKNYTQAPDSEWS